MKGRKKELFELLEKLRDIRETKEKIKDHKKSMYVKKKIKSV